MRFFTAIFLSGVAALVSCENTVKYADFSFKLPEQKKPLSFETPVEYDIENGVVTIDLVRERSNGLEILVNWRDFRSRGDYSEWRRDLLEIIRERGFPDAF